MENLVNDSMIAIDNVVLTNETCINTQESESNPPLTGIKVLSLSLSVQFNTSNIKQSLYVPLTII